jgi:hypothetical protein
LLPGATDLRVTFAGVEKQVAVSVGDDSALQELSVANELNAENLLEIEGIGESLQLNVDGKIEQQGVESVIAMEDSRLGTLYTVQDGSILEVSADGLITALELGTTSITVSNRFASVPSVTITVEVKNGPPTISLSANRSYVFEKSALSLTASVDDDRGSESVASVQFFVDGQPVYTDTEAPFTMSVEGPERRAGTYLRITAVATDFDGDSAESEPLDILVKPLGDVDTVGGALKFFTSVQHFDFLEQLGAEGKVGYTPNMTAISEGSQFVVGSILNFAVTAEDAAYDKVEFFVNGVVVATTRSATSIVYTQDGYYPEVAAEVAYRAGYVIPELEAGRGLIVTAVGYKGEYEVYSDAIALEAVVNRAPSVRFTSHVDLDSIRDGGTTEISVNVSDDLIVYGAEVTLQLTHLDSGEVITLTQNDQSAAQVIQSALDSSGERNYTFSVEIPDVSSGSRYQVVARASDYYGEVADADITLIVQSNQAPQIQIVSPVDGSNWVAGTVLPLRASVVDDGAVDPAGIAFYVNNKLVHFGSLTFNYEIPPELAGMTGNIVARVLDDEGLAGTADAEVYFGADTVAPSVVISAPADNSMVTFNEGSETTDLGFLMTGFDNIGIASVALYESTAPDSPLVVADLDSIIVNQDGSYLVALSWQFFNSDYSNDQEIDV